MGDYDLTDTKRYKVFSNGAIYDNDVKRIVAILPAEQGGYRFDSEAGRAAVAKRRRLAEQAARRGIQEGTGAESVWGGVRAMSAAMAGLAASGQGLASVKAYEAIMRQAGLTADKGGGAGGESGLSLSASESALREVRGLIDSLRALQAGGDSADNGGKASGAGGGVVDV